MFYQWITRLCIFKIAGNLADAIDVLDNLSEELKAAQMEAEELLIENE